jgi:hypothetical protein
MARLLYEALRLLYEALTYELHQIMFAGCWQLSP